MTAYNHGRHRSLFTRPIMTIYAANYSILKVFTQNLKEILHIALHAIMHLGPL